MKFLIFGGTGFVGSNLVRYIRSQGGEAISVSRSGADGGISMDINRPLEFNNLKVSPDVVVNCASRIPAKGKTSRDPQFLQELFDTNVIGGANIANWATKNNVKHLINCSTLVVVRKPWPIPLTESFSSLPEGPHVGYSMSKLSQEQIMQECLRGTGTKLLNLRLSAVYGKGMTPEGIIFFLLEKLRNNEAITLTDASKNSLDLIHVEDVCRSIYTIAEESPSYKEVNLARGEQVTIEELANKLKELTGSTSQISSSDTDNPASEAIIDIQRLQTIIGDNSKDFIPLEVGLKEIISSYKN